MPQDACYLPQRTINMSSPHSLSLFDMGFKWQTSFSEYGIICIVGLNCSMPCTQQTSTLLLSLAWGFKLSMVMKMFFENWLWKLILHVCMFPVTKARGWNGGWPIVISSSLRSPSSDSVLLSLFPKDPFISTPCLKWELVSAAQFLLFCLEAAVNVCFL